MTESKYIQVNQNALIEIIHDDLNSQDFDYSIIHDQKNNTKSFVINSPSELNTIQNQLFSIDKTINKFGILDFNKYNFLTKTEYVNNQFSEYTKVKVWFPINYIFNDTNGFFLNIYTLDFNNKTKYDLSNFYLDKSNATMYNSIELETKPFRMNNKVWGKSVTLLIPSVSFEANMRPNNQAKVGTINYNLAGSTGLSITSPIYFDFRFLFNKKTILNELTYYTTGQLIFSTPQTIINNFLSVSIKPATDGDYYTINGAYNGSTGELDKYMEAKAYSGDQSYILYTIIVYEDNIPQTSRDIYVYENFNEGIKDYRPVIKYTNVLASIKVEMKIISNVSDTMDLKSTEYILTGNEVAKYGRYLSSINVTNAIKPKLYNSAPTRINLPTKDIINSFFKRKESKKLELRYVPYPVLFSSSTIAVQNISTNSNVTPNGGLMLELKPFDNIFKLSVVNYTSESTYEGYSIPVENTIVNLVFKSESSTVRINLYIESNEVDLKNGILVFKINQSDLKNIQKIYVKSKSFYITLITNDVETVLYNGRFKVVSDIVPPTPPIVIPTIKNPTSGTRKPSQLIEGNFFGLQMQEMKILESGKTLNTKTIKTKFNL